MAKTVDKYIMTVGDPKYKTKLLIPKDGEFPRLFLEYVSVNEMLHIYTISPFDQYYFVVSLIDFGDKTATQYADDFIQYVKDKKLITP